MMIKFIHYLKHIVYKFVSFVQLLKEQKSQCYVLTGVYENRKAVSLANENDNLPRINPNDANCHNEQINKRINQEEIQKCVNFFF